MCARVLRCFVLTVLLGACSAVPELPGEPPGSIPVDPRSVLDQQTTRLQPAIPPDIEDTEAGLSGSLAPDGVEPELWRQLTAELARLLAERPPAATEHQPAIMRYNARQASFTPYGEQNHISDLQLTGSGPFRLTWSYRNSGDYDLNGEVNTSDLTAIALNFGIARPNIRWPVASLADGDANGEVNLADITPIAQNFQGCIVGYRLYATDNPAGEWDYLGQATMETNLYRNTDRPFFRILLDTLQHEYYALWPYDNSDDEGGWSLLCGRETAVLRKFGGVKKLW